MHKPGFFPNALIIALPLMLLVSCSSTETNYKIIDVFHRPGSNQVQLLYTVTREQSTCPIGAHGCTYETLAQELRHVTLPLAPGMVPHSDVVAGSTWIHSGTDQNDFTYYRSGGAVAFGNTRSQVLDICPISGTAEDDVAACIDSRQLQAPDDERSPIVISNSGNAFLWHDVLYTLPALQLTNLLEKPGYQSFLNAINNMEKEYSVSASTKIFLFDDTLLVAKAPFASAVNAPLGLVYSLPDDTMSAVTKNFTHGDVSIEVIAVQHYQNQLYFLLNFSSFAEGTLNRVRDDYYLYSTSESNLTAIENPSVGDGETVWEVGDQLFYDIVWVNGRGIRITATPLRPLE